jgi:hypothetical protein
MALLKNPVLWCRASAFLAHEYARFDKTDLESISASILKVYNRLGEQTRLAANDVPALLERAKNLKSAAQIIEKWVRSVVTSFFLTRLGRTFRLPDG